VTARAIRASAAGGAVVLIALHLWLARGRSDFLLADGTGYLANARWLAGHADGTWQGAAAFYHAGWSLLVAPAYVVTRDPDAIHTYVIILNALLATGSAIACALVARRVFELPARWSLLAGLVAGTYPAVLLQSGFEWSESLYALLFPLFVLVAHRLVQRPSPVVAAGTGLAAAALNATHPKGIGVVAAIALALVAFAWRRSLPRREIAIAMAALVVGFAATRLLHGALQDALYDDSAAAIEGGVLSRLREPALLWGTFQRAWGQSWYLAVATLGLAPLGVWATWRQVDRRTSTLVLGSIVLVFAASCLQMSDGTRVDHLVYGRYVEGFVPVLLVAGVAGLVGRERWSLRLAAAGAAGLAVLGVLALLFNGVDRFTGDVMPLNVLGVLVYQTSRDEVLVVLVTALAIAGMVAVAIVHRARPAAALVVLAGFFVASSAAVEARTLQPWSSFWMRVSDIPEVVERIDDDARVAYALEAHDVDAANAYQLELADRGGLTFFDRRVPDGFDLAIATPRWNAAPKGSRLAYVESPPFDQALWVLPGALQDELAERGLLLPEQTSAPLPADAQRAELSIDGNTVHVRNVGRGSWLPVGPIAGVVEGTVRLGARWFDADGVEVASETAELPRVLLPGDDADVHLRLEPELGPGEYTLVIALRQESVAWWDDSAIERQVVVRS
jgi:hypothetical protein